MAALQSVGNAVGALAASFIGGARLLAGFLSALLVATCAVTSIHVRGLSLQDAAEEVAPAPLRVTRPFVDLFISRALVYAGFYTLLGYLLFYVQGVLGIAALADAKRHTGILIITFTVVGALGAALAARPSDRLDKRLVATVGAGAFIAALGIFIATQRIQRGRGGHARGRPRLGSLSGSRLGDCLPGAAARGDGDGDGDLEHRHPRCRRSLPRP